MSNTGPSGTLFVNIYLTPAQQYSTVSRAKNPVQVITDCTVKCVK